MYANCHRVIFLAGQADKIYQILLHLDSLCYKYELHLTEIVVPDYTLSTGLGIAILKESEESQPGQHEDPEGRHIL